MTSSGDIKKVTLITSTWTLPCCLGELPHTNLHCLNLLNKGHPGLGCCWCITINANQSNIRGLERRAAAGRSTHDGASTRKHARNSSIDGFLRRRKLVEVLLKHHPENKARRKSIFRARKLFSSKPEQIGCSNVLYNYLRSDG